MEIIQEIDSRCRTGCHGESWNKHQMAITIMSHILASNIISLTLSWRRPVSYRDQSIDLLRKSMDWFLYNGLGHERVNGF